MFLFVCESTSLSTWHKVNNVLQWLLVSGHMTIQVLTCRSVMDHLARENDWMDNWCFDGQRQLYVLEELPPGTNVYQVSLHMDLIVVVCMVLMGYTMGFTSIIYVRCVSSSGYYYFKKYRKAREVRLCFQHVSMSWLVGVVVTAAKMINLQQYEVFSNSNIVEAEIAFMVYAGTRHSLA
jgi:hypothetical protein